MEASFCLLQKSTLDKKARFGRNFGALAQMDSEIGRFAADFNYLFILFDM